MISPLPGNNTPGHTEAPATPPSPPAVDEGASSGLTDEEAQEQRALMEREVHDQTRFLDRSAVHARHEVPGAAPTAAPESERVRGETLSLDELLAFRGTQLLAANGDEIGEIGEIYFDEASRRPEWIGADVHRLLGSTRVVAPVLGSYVLMSAISVPYNLDTVLEAPAGDLLITGEHEAQLYAHYEIPYSRNSSPTGLPAAWKDEEGGRLDGPYLSDTLADTVGVVPGPAGPPTGEAEFAPDRISDRAPADTEFADAATIAPASMPYRAPVTALSDWVVPETATSRGFPASLSGVAIGGIVAIAVAIPIAIGAVAVYRRRHGSPRGIRSRVLHRLHR